MQSWKGLGGEAAWQPGLRDKMQRDNAGRERKMHTWLSLAGNFKVQGLNGWKKTSAVRQWMAKENREAEHMLGHNDPKRTNKNKRHTKKKTHKWKEHEYNKKQWQKSISQQEAQAMLRSSCPLCIHEEHCFCLLTISTQHVTRERKKTQLIIKHGILKIGNPHKQNDQQVLIGDKTRK